MLEEFDKAKYETGFVGGVVPGRRGPLTESIILHSFKDLEACRPAAIRSKEVTGSLRELTISIFRSSAGSVGCK